MDPVGLYVHLPFCEIKCHYCDFFSITGRDEDTRDTYVRTLIREIETRATHEPADTIFFGGGTPSVLTSDQIGRILASLRSAFQVTPDAEITMEANPETVTPASLRGFREAGVNRISFGVQTLDDAILKALGRIHSADRARAAVGEAKSAGFDRLNADLMFGLPDQSPERWTKDLTEVLGWPIDHLSAYELTIEKDTTFGIHPPTLPTEEAALAMWETVMVVTGSKGFRQYEVSNYAKPGSESRHNLKYWKDETVIGFGASAWGHRDGTRTANPRNLRTYLENAAKGFPPDASDTLPADRRPAETLVLNLRMRDGCREDLFNLRYGPGALDRFAAVLAPHEAAGRVERKDGVIRLTPRGLLVANEIWGGIYGATG